ncbi:MAG TPA: hypothetical protein DEF41_06125 [Desulfovibrio sp.]|nr:hypothetical protein [Desulfovibrio sp.]
MRRTAHNRDAGFTLIEIITVLVLTGILAAVAGMAMPTAIRGFIAAREGTELAQEAQLALDRISRELIETINVTASSESSVTLESVDHFTRINRSGNAIIIAEGSSTPVTNAGDMLIDGVTAFSLSYWNGGGVWDKTDSRDLTAIDVSLTLRAPAGTTRTFVNRVVPRNNENNGGAETTMAPPNLSEFSACFVATAAFGDTTHPAVVALREFRDKKLMTWAGGRKIVAVYYTVGPYLADAIRPFPAIRHICAALLSVLAMMGLLAVHAPLGLAALLMLGTLFFAKRTLFYEIFRYAFDKLPAQRNAQQGAVLISTIVAITAISMMLASMVPMMTAATQSEYFALRGDQAYYLAESGFNTAASLFLAQPDDQSRKNLLESLDRATYTLQGGEGSFRYEVEPYWYEVTDLTSNEIKAHAYGTPPSAARFSPKWIRIGTGNVFREVSALSISGKTLTFQGRDFSGIIRSDVYVAAASAQTNLRENGILTLKQGHGSAFPEVNGMITLRGTGFDGRTPYVYKRRDGDILRGIRLADKDATFQPTTVPQNTMVTLEAFIRLASTGNAPDGTARRVVYNVPIGWMLGGGAFSKEQYQDTFDTNESLNHFWQNTGYDDDDGHIGSHSTKDIDGSRALQVTGMQALNEGHTGWLGTIIDGLIGILNRFQGKNLWSTLFFNWGATTANVAQSWMDAGGYINYDLQFKMKASDQSTSSTNGLRFFGGVGFRGFSKKINPNLSDFPA